MLICQKDNVAIFNETKYLQNVSHKEFWERVISLVKEYEELRKLATISHSGNFNCYRSANLEAQSEPQKTEPHEKPVRFAVQSLGWVRIAEEDLTPERSSRAVNKCIVDLSFGRNDINDVVGRWGDVSVTDVSSCRKDT